MFASGLNKRVLCHIIVFVAITRCHGYVANTTNSFACSVPRFFRDTPNPANTTDCPPNTTATLQDAQNLAPKVAPVVLFHPLEQYYLMDIDK